MNPSLLIMLAAWAFVAAWTAGVVLSQRRVHPKALFYLFFVELWERFSYYGMRALLILYLTKAFGFADDKAYGIYGAYGALVYATPVLGGLIADKFLGLRNSIKLGAVLMALGHFAMALPQRPVLFLALGFLIVGNGFFKPNISSLVGKLYPDGDARRDSAFTLFYMGVNTGAFLTPLTCGAIGELYGWHWGFSLAGIGMVTGLAIFLAGGRANAYEDKGLPPDPALLTKKIARPFRIDHLFYAVVFLCVPVMAFLVKHNETAKWFLGALGTGMLLYLLGFALRQEKQQREKLFVILALFVFTVLFWTFFELAGSSINLFTDRNVNRTLAGFTLPTSMFQGVNPLFIILLAPLFAAVWKKLADIARPLSAPAQFGLGLLQLGAGFLVLVAGARLAGPAGLAPLWSLVLAYLLHTTGELCLSPIGLSLVTKLSPKSIAAFVMGIWFLSSSFAHTIGAEISKLTSQPAEASAAAVIAPAHGLQLYAGVFWNVGLIAIGAGVVLFLLVPVLKRWMHGVK
ncbi:MAG TPA: peptide MFS transporter [Chitinivibrionales bacterium]|nr:peptide MFS transporter [Chitinivibrionales bacterium]